VREIVKHLLLLEDHLAHARKQCPDCIRKHLMTCEALADEAVALDPTGIHHAVCGDLGEKVRGWTERLCDGCGPGEVCRDIRTTRKSLTPLVFDPRGEAAVARVASAYMHRVACNHRTAKDSRSLGYTRPAEKMVPK